MGKGPPEAVSNRKNHKPHKEEKPRKANTLDTENRICIRAEVLGQELGDEEREVGTGSDEMKQIAGIAWTRTGYS